MQTLAIPYSQFGFVACISRSREHNCQCFLGEKDCFVHTHIQFYTYTSTFIFHFLHITRYSFDPRIANANQEGSDLFIYLFFFFTNLI